MNEDQQYLKVKHLPISSYLKHKQKSATPFGMTLFNFIYLAHLNKML